MEAVLEGDDRVAPGVVAGDLDRVLDRLGAGVDQHRALLVVAGRQPVERLAHRDIALVRRHHRAGVGELLDLALDGLDHCRGAGPDVDDGDAGAEVDEGVAVDVDHDAAAGAWRRRPASCCPSCAGIAALRRAASSRDRGPGDLGDQTADLLEIGHGAAAPSAVRTPAWSAADHGRRPKARRRADPPVPAPVQGSGGSAQFRPLRPHCGRAAWTSPATTLSPTSWSIRSCDCGPPASTRSISNDSGIPAAE